MTDAQAISGSAETRETAVMQRARRLGNATAAVIRYPLVGTLKIIIMGMVA